MLLTTVQGTLYISLFNLFCTSLLLQIMYSSAHFHSCFHDFDLFIHSNHCSWPAAAALQASFWITIDWSCCQRGKMFKGKKLFTKNFQQQIWILQSQSYYQGEWKLLRGSFGGVWLWCSTLTFQNVKFYILKCKNFFA